MSVNLGGQIPVAPVAEQIGQCAVNKVELPDGGMALIFTIPGIRSYHFLLDANGRRIVAQLCGLTITSDMPGGPSGNHR